MKKTTMLIIVLIIVVSFACNSTKAEDSMNATALVQYQTIGSIVSFGTYPQEIGGTDKTPIEWIVLDYNEDENKALLISKYAIDMVPYHEEWANVTWETCTLRAWLNSDFIHTAFSPEEQSAILITEVDNSSSQNYKHIKTDGGNNTQDQLFLLSYAEAHHYFGVEDVSETGSSNNLVSRVSPTAYVFSRLQFSENTKFTQTADGEKALCWWLRSPGSDQSLAGYVDCFGSFMYGAVSEEYILDRPAFWLDLRALP